MHDNGWDDPAQRDDPYGGNFSAAADEARRRQRGCCAICGIYKGDRLHAHHFQRRYPSGESVTADDLIGLCGNCHLCATNRRRLMKKHGDDYYSGKEERDKQILALAREGKPYKVIAEKVGVSKVRVSETCIANGLRRNKKKRDLSGMTEKQRRDDTLQYQKGYQASYYQDFTKKGKRKKDAGKRD